MGLSVSKFFARGAAGARRWVVVVAVASAFLGFAGLAGTRASAALPVASLAASAPAQANFGTIKGRLVWAGADVPQPKVLAEVGKAPKDPQVCAKDRAIVSRDLVVDPKTRGIQNGFAYLVRPSGTNPVAVQDLVKQAAKVEIDQKNCEFIPYCTAMHQEQVLEFKSSDPVNHNIRYAAFTNAPLNQMLPPNGKLDQKLVAERRPIPLACDIHPWMKGYIMVFDHPFFAVTGPDGSFEIQGVPAGQQNLVVWQESVGYVTAGLARGTPVKVAAGGVTDVGDIKLVPKNTALR